MGQVDTESFYIQKKNVELNVIIQPTIVQYIDWNRAEFQWYDILFYYINYMRSMQQLITIIIFCESIVSVSQQGVCFSLM